MPATRAKKPKKTPCRPPHATGVSKRGLEFIARFEGCVLRPYDDGGRPGIGNATIGVGHLLHMGPCTAADRRRWRGFTRTKAIGLLRRDAAHAAAAVRALGVPLNQHEFDALTSFAFNCGPGALAGGIARHLHAGDRAGAMDVLREYVHAGGHVYPGLVRRRNAEAHLFLAGTY